MNRNNSRRRVLKILSATLSSAYSTSDIFSPFAGVWFIISSSSSLLSDWLQDQPIPKTFSTKNKKNVGINERLVGAINSIDHL